MNFKREVLLPLLFLTSSATAGYLYEEAPLPSKILKRSLPVLNGLLRSIDRRHHLPSAKLDLPPYSSFTSTNPQKYQTFSNLSIIYFSQLTHPRKIRVTRRRFSFLPFDLSKHHTGLIMNHRNEFNPTSISAIKRTESSHSTSKQVYLNSDKILKKIQMAKEFKLILDPDKDILKEIISLRKQMLTEIYGQQATAMITTRDKYDAHSRYCVIQAGIKLQEVAV